MFLSTLRHSALISSLALPAVLLLAAGTARSEQRSADGVWQVVAESDAARAGGERWIVPQQYRTFALDRAALDTVVARAPAESQVPVARSTTLLSLPTPDGGFARFRIVDAPVMAPELAARYPQIRTWLGQGVDDPATTVRFDLTPAGFHAQMIGNGGTSYIDPYQRGDTTHYLAYRKRDHVRTDAQRVCTVTGSTLPTSPEQHDHAGPQPAVVSGATLRTYRLAMAATAEYTTFHGGTVLDGLGGVVTTVNRVNGIYERELSVRMVLVANNDVLIHTDPNTDPYTNSSGTTMLGQNITSLGTLIGNANFDVGHVVSTGGGGVAGLGVVCGTSKARGVTGSSQPIGDAFDVDYVAHEMGHQFAGNHTFNGSAGSCSGGNRNAGTAYEPGSGITIQAYAGICGADNTQPNSEDYFHRVSLNEMLAFTTTGSGNCGVQSATGNTPPTVSTAASFTIPVRTPFELTASGTDAENDPLTYLWEQFNLGSANTPGTLVDANGAVFRSFVPVASPSRVFPSLRYILGSANVVPDAFPLEGTTTPNRFTAERLPTVSRTMNFRVTVRDNRAGGGGTNEASTQVVATDTAGPFLVTAPNSSVSWAAGSQQTVTWDVANTNTAPVSAANVRITLSLDGGYTWPTELAASVPNNGSASVTIPANTPASAQARIRVQAVDNIFFDVSNNNFAITAGSNTAPSISVTGSVSTRQGSPTASAAVATISDTQDAATALTVAISGAPQELGVAVVNNAGVVTLSATAQCTLVSPSGSGTKAYPLLLTVTDSAGSTSTAFVNVNVGANQVPVPGLYDLPIYVPRGGSSGARLPGGGISDPNGNLAPATLLQTTFSTGGTLAIAANGAITASAGATTPLGITGSLRMAANDSCGAAELRSFSVEVTELLRDGME